MIQLVAIVKTSDQSLVLEIKALLASAIFGKVNSQVTKKLPFKIATSIDFCVWQESELYILRVTGEKRYRKSEQELENGFNVNLCKANEVFAISLNRMASSPLLAIPSPLHRGSVVLGAEHLSLILEKYPDALDQALKLAYESEFRGKVPDCNCDW